MSPPSQDGHSVGQRGPVLRRGVPGGLSVAAMSSHLPLLYRVWAEQLPQWWDRQRVAV